MKKITLIFLLSVVTFTSAFADASDGEWRITYDNQSNYPVTLQVANNLPNHLTCWITGPLNDYKMVTIPGHSRKEITTVMDNYNSCNTASQIESVASPAGYGWHLLLNMKSTGGLSKVVGFDASAGGIATSKGNQVSILTDDGRTIQSSKGYDYFYPASAEAHLDATIKITPDNNAFVESLAVYYPYG